MATNVSLVSLAILKVNADENHQDYLDFLIPFLREIIGSQEVAIRDSSVQETLQTKYGLRVPRQTIQLCLLRLERRRELKKNIYGGFNQTGIFRAAGLEDLRAKTTRQLQSLLAEFVQLVLAESGQGWTDDRATSALLSFLDHFGIESLKAYSQRTAVEAKPYR
jgi:hypothetical protein